LTRLDAGGRSVPIPVHRRAPGLFEGLLPQITYGQDEQFVWTLRDAKQQARATSYGFVYSFSPEYRTLSPNLQVFDRLRSEKLGTVFSVGQTPCRSGTSSSPAGVELWPYLLVAALLLVPVDIACRRLG